MLAAHGVCFGCAVWTFEKEIVVTYFCCNNGVFEVCLVWIVTISSIKLIGV